MKKFEELSLKRQSDILTFTNLFKNIIGIIILSIGLSDIFIEDKGSFWSILYSIIGFVLIFIFKYNYKTFLEIRKLEKNMD